MWATLEGVFWPLYVCTFFFLHLVLLDRSRRKLNRHIKAPSNLSRRPSPYWPRIVAWMKWTNISWHFCLFCLDSHTLNKIVTGVQVPSSRSSATMAGVGSKLYVFGGLSRDYGWLNDLYAFDTGMTLKISIVLKWAPLLFKVLSVKKKHWNK